MSTTYKTVGEYIDTLNTKGELSPFGKTLAEHFDVEDTRDYTLQELSEEIAEVYEGAGESPFTPAVLDAILTDQDLPCKENEEALGALFDFCNFPDSDFMAYANFLEAAKASQPIIAKPEAETETKSKTETNEPIALISELLEGKIETARLLALQAGDAELLTEEEANLLEGLIADFEDDLQAEEYNFLHDALRAYHESLPSVPFEDAELEGKADETPGMEIGSKDASLDDGPAWHVVSQAPEERIIPLEDAGRLSENKAERNVQKAQTAAYNAFLSGAGHDLTKARKTLDKLVGDHWLRIPEHGLLIEGKDFSRMTLHKLRWTNSHIEKCKLGDVRNSDFSRATLERCDLSQADFEGSNVSGLTLIDCTNIPEGLEREIAYQSDAAKGTAIAA